MKKILSLCAAVLFAGSMFAEDATLVAGTTASDAKVNEGKAIKIGNSKGGGDMTIVVGDGATLLTFHAAGWKATKDEKNPTTTITFSTEDAGVELSANKYVLNNDDNFTGSATKFTITNEDDYELPLEITGAKDGATIKISADRRCVIWGATYEVGEAPKVAKPVIAPENDEFVDEATITITCATEGAKIYYRLDGTYPFRDKEGTLLYSEPFKIEASTQIQAVAVLGDDESKTVYRSYVKVEPWDVSNAISALTGASPINGKYVSGTICQIDKFNESDGTITYWISDDGKAGGNDHMLEVYHGLGLNGDEFVTGDALQVGDQVIVYGNLKVYKQDGKDDIFEFDKNSYIVKLVEKSPAEAIDNTAVEAKAVKSFENGQLIIIKNGVKYTTTGTVVK